LIADACAGKLSPCASPFARMPFDQANELYQRDRAPNLSEATRRSEFDHSTPLRKFFRQKPLGKITEKMIRDYIAMRHKSVANAKINKELYILRGMLKRAKRWQLFADDIKALKVPESTVGRALESDERLRLLRAGEGNPRWTRALLAAQLSLNTTMRRGEVRKLQWKDVDLIERWIHVRKGKSAKAAREIPLNPEAFEAVLKLREQAKALFGDSLSAEWYVFFWWPASCEPDPTRPAGGWRSAWRSLVKTAGLGRLRFHDLRHSAITDRPRVWQASRPSWRLPDTSRQRCWSTTRTFVETHGGLPSRSCTGKMSELGGTRAQSRGPLCTIRVHRVQKWCSATLATY